MASWQMAQMEEGILLIQEMSGEQHLRKPCKQWLLHISVHIFCILMEQYMPAGEYISYF
jgi:hypothetical protein